MPRSTIGSVSILTLVLTITLAACGGGGDASAGPGATGATGPADATGATGADCVDFTGGTATITISDFAFDPTCFTVSASQELTFVNKDTSAHKFVGAGLEVPIDGKSTVKVKSLSDIAPGTYTFACAFHPTMRGTMTVQ